MLYEPCNNTLCDNETDEFFICMYMQYKDEVYQQAFHLTSCHYKAEDIVQDVFLKLWKHKHRWGEIDDIKAYLFFCTRNTTIDYFKRVKIEKVKLQELSQTILLYDSPEVKIEMQEAQKLHDKAVDRLPAQQRKVYTLGRLYGWKRKKIAQELHLSGNTVKQHMQVAIRSLRKFMVEEMVES